MIIQSTQVRVPFRLIKSDGTAATGILAADMLNGVIGVIKADGSTTTITPVLNTNFWEIGAQNPGLYHIQLTTGMTNILGPIQYSIYPTATAFVATVMGDTIVADSATAASITSAVSSIKGGSNRDITQIETSIKGTGNRDITQAETSIKGVSGVDLTQIAGVGFNTANDSLKQLSTAVAAISVSGVASAVWDTVRSVHITGGTFGEAIRVIIQCLRGHVKIDTINNTLVVYAEDGTTPLFTSNLKDSMGNAASVLATERMAGA
jgi:hypothetical protein